MRFELIDRVLEIAPDRIVTVKNVSNAEEYLLDHFPGFPVLPGVFMIEAMVHAARRLLVHTNPARARHVLGGVRALKYGTFVRPGDAMRVTVTLEKSGNGEVFDFKGSAAVIAPTGGEAGATARGADGALDGGLDGGLGGGLGGA
ncbi:MAG: polyketide synthase dehydratase domain-containing protein, partial [Phycisphaerales bacterium]|nr:polyketide synthase dehydratase domain-containing protein [Phycisphaerales bacterium]